MTTEPVRISAGGPAKAAALRPLKPDAVAAAHEPQHPAAARPDDFNLSVAGEEDPGASLDLIDPESNAPAAWCPWPRGRSS